MAEEQLVVVLKDGSKITGTAEQIKTFMETMGLSFDQDNKEEVQGPIYHSESKGKVLISSMATPWIKNAIVKSFRKQIEELAQMDIYQFKTALMENDYEDLFSTEEIDDLIEDLIGRELS